ncbi:MAG: leucyl/phenylalanyl-tRNA--protein transferase [Methylococcaceae bacterium]
MLAVLNPLNPQQKFPPVTQAARNPNGLLAMGGCLSLPRLENAYRQGIFPWFNAGEPILWWSPDPRLILYPEQLKVSRSLGKTLRRGVFEFSFDKAFSHVIRACSSPRDQRLNTWISADMIAAYEALHQHGLAHSFETWHCGTLVGGLYGVAMGQVFFGESMFHDVTDASKAALVFACHKLSGWGYRLIDCQVHTGHLASLGAFEIPRDEFAARLAQHVSLAPAPNAWVQKQSAPNSASAKYPWLD